MLHIALNIENRILALGSHLGRHLEIDHFLMFIRTGTFSILKMELKPTV